MAGTFSAFLLNFMNLESGQPQEKWPPFCWQFPLNDKCQHSSNKEQPELIKTTKSKHSLLDDTFYRENHVVTPNPKLSSK